MKRLNLHPDYPYAYETHLHTSEGSACSPCPGKDMARACYEAGYTGIIVTNHFIYGNTSVDRSLPWKEWVEQYAKGYENAAEEGERLGLQVFFGWEAAYNGTEFLVNGLTKQWLLDHPEIKDATVEEQYRLVKASGGMVVHCHPYREEDYIPEIRLFPEFVDAVEGVNATHACSKSRSHNQPEFDVRAREYAAKHHFPMTSGSDIHVTDLLYGGVAFSRKLTDAADYCKAIMGGENCVLLSGNETISGAPYLLSGGDGSVREI